MDARTAWANLAQAIAEVHRPGGDYSLKLETVSAAVVLLFEHPAHEILEQVEGSPLPTRAVVSWLVFEGDRLPEVAPEPVRALRELYEATCPPGQGIIPPPPTWAKVGTA
ncbi:MAG: hypothetical protein Kow0092_03230 [Deferrisomatales bacterium]